MQKWIRKAAHSLAAAQGADQSQEDVIAYGLTALCQIGAILLGALVIGLAAGMVWECLLIYLVVGTFRKCTGGAHAPSLLGCILTSLLTIGAMAGLARYLLAPRLTPLAASLCLLAFVWIWWIIIRRVPVDSPNKPIRRPEKIRRLRRQSFVYAGVCTLACAGTAAAYWLRPLPTTALSVYASLILALCWQSFTLTAPAGLLLCRRGGK